MRRLLLLLVVLGVVGAPAPVLATGPGDFVDPEIAAEFREEWRLRFDQKDARALRALLEDWRAFQLSHGSDGYPRSDWPPGVERWRTLLDDYFFAADVETALAIIACESAGNPRAENARSTATGLWQHLARYWDTRSQRAGVGGASIFDPEASTIVAAWLVYETGGSWKHWSCYDGPLQPEDRGRRATLGLPQVRG